MLIPGVVDSHLHVLDVVDSHLNVPDKGRKCEALQCRIITKVSHGAFRTWVQWSLPQVTAKPLGKLVLLMA